MSQTIEICGPATPGEAARLVREAFGDKVRPDQAEAETLDGAPECVGSE